MPPKRAAQAGGRAAKTAKKQTPTKGQLTLVESMAREASASPSSKGGAEPSGAKPKPLGGALCTLRADAHEWSQTHVTQIDIEADRGIKTQSAAEALLNDLVFLDGFRRVLMENPDKVPPQSMCEALISIMHESRVAPERSVEVATSGFQLLQLMHRLQPHVTLHTRRDADDLTSKGLGLLVHPLAWAPIDGDARARASIVGGGAQARGAREDAAALMRLLTAAAEGTTTKTNHLGTLLLLKHTVDLLTHDLACRTRVFRAQNNIDVVRESSVWRLLVMANISLPHHRRTLLQLLFTMIAGGAPVECEDTHDAGDDAQVVISAAEISAVAQRVLCMTFEASEALEKAGEFNSARTLRAENLSEALYREAADQLRTQLDSLAKQSHCLQTMLNPRHKLRLVRMALGHNVSARAAPALHAGGSGGASGAYDIVAYLAADCKGAALAERSGRDTPEHAMNRVALYLAHSLHAVAVSPASLRGDEVREALPRVVAALRTELRASKGNESWRLELAVEAALTAAELALMDATPLSTQPSNTPRVDNIVLLDD